MLLNSIHIINNFNARSNYYGVVSKSRMCKLTLLFAEIVFFRKKISKNHLNVNIIFGDELHILLTFYTVTLCGTVS